MPEISLAGNFGLIIDADLSPSSIWAKYLRKPGLIEGAIHNLKPWNGVEIGQDPFDSKTLGFSFSQPLDLGIAAAEVTVEPEATASVDICKGASLFDGDSDDFGETVTIPPQHAYLSGSIHAEVEVSAAEKVESLSFFFARSSGITIGNYRLFALTDKVTPAVESLFGSFFIPASLDDIRAMPEDSLATVTGDGSFTFGATANLLSSVNPLASLALPVPGASLNLKEGASLSVGGHFTLTGGFQIRVHRQSGNRCVVGFLKKRGSEVAVTVAADVGLSAGVEGFELIQRVLTLVSPEAAPDKKVLANAGLDDGQIATISAAVKASIERSLQLSLTAELDLLESSSTAFSYEVDLDALNAQGSTALEHALHGDLTAIEAGNLHGITPLTSIFTNSEKRTARLKLNLLGVFNYASVVSLFTGGTMIVDRDTGQITITDKVGANRIDFTSDNFVKKPEQLRKVLAESLLVTATYRAGRGIFDAPEFSSKLWFVDYQRNGDFATLQSYFLVAQALKLTSAADVAAKLNPFVRTPLSGRTILNVESVYHTGLFESLFLDEGGKPRAENEYQNLGRQALAALLPAGSSTLSQARLRPLTDDSMWLSMQGGVTTFRTVLVANRAIRPEFLPDIEADFTAIVWWAAAMHDLAVVLSRLLVNPSSAQLRNDLQQKLKSVAANTHSHFGTPWGLVVMDLASGLRAATNLQITNPTVSFVSLPAAAKASGTS